MKKNGPIQISTKPLKTSDISLITLDHFGPNTRFSKPYVSDLLEDTQKPSVQILVQKTVQKTVRAIIGKSVDS
jgi:hypothetical protein